MKARLSLDKVQNCIGMISYQKEEDNLERSANSRWFAQLNFLRRVIDLTTGKRSPISFIRLTRSVKDLSAWLSFLSPCNCLSIYSLDVWNNSVKLSFYTDMGAL